MDQNSRSIGPLIGGLLLVAFGVLALLAQMVPGLNFWSDFWPFIIVAFGAMFFAIMFASGKSAGGLAIPGSIFVGIGLMMVIQNLTNHWESWAYGWTVIIFSVGVGIYIMGFWSEVERQRQAGKRLMGLGLVLFVVFGAFFEMIFNSTPIAQFVFPVALIVLGGYLVVARAGVFGSSRPAKIVEQTPKKRGSNAKTS